ncbi:MAG TPA: hypothetical protein VL996_07405 [Methylocella sp.]|nr:hypothetical protein [Methylocella sp.]
MDRLGFGFVGEFLLDPLHHIDKFPLSGAIALCREPYELAHDGSDRWKREYIVAFSHGDRPISFLQDHGFCL